MIPHGYANLWQSYLMLSSGSFTAQVAYGVLFWVLAACVLTKYDVQTLTHRIPPAAAPRQARAG